MGMDPISLIAAAVVTGAAAGATKVAGKAVNDAYQGLKELLQQRFAAKPPALMVLAELESDPKVWEAPLKKTLHDIDAANDDELIAVAQRLRDALAQEQRNLAGGGVLIQDARNVAFDGGRVANVDIGGAVTGSAVVASAGNVTGAVTASSIGGGERADVERLFEDVLNEVRKRPADPDVDNREIQMQVEQVRDEASKGLDANPTKIKRWLRALRDVAPDICQTVGAVLRRPEVGLPNEVRDAVDQTQASDTSGT